MKRTCIAALTAIVLGLCAAPAQGGEVPCDLEPRTACFGLDFVDVSLSTTQAGDHPDLTFSFEMKLDPETKPNVPGFKNGYATPRDIRFELPPGLIGDPNVLGPPQQCMAEELIGGSGCPNGSQVGRSVIYGYSLMGTFTEPVYMMVPPSSGNVVARLGTIAGAIPTFIDFKVRSESDYGLVAEVVDAPTAVRLVRLETTTWGVPTDPIHDTERCTPAEVLSIGCVVSPPRPPGSRQLPFLTNPTRCGVPLEMRVAASSWNAPDVFDTASAAFPQISGCDKLPFTPDLTVEPTSHRAGVPTGLDVTVRVPASDGAKVLEPSQVRDIRVNLPKGLAVNPSSADGLDICSESQVHFGERVDAECPDAAKLAVFEAEIPALPRRMKGAIYLREPEPGNLFRFWAVADDLGVHVKLQGQLIVDEETGQIESVLLDAPQAPLREVKIIFKSGFRAPLVNPEACGTYTTEYEFVPWSAGPPVRSSSSMTIDEGCEGVGGFDPKLSAGTIDPTAGTHSPFVFKLTRQDGEQSPSTLDLTLPKGLAATLTGVPRCEGTATETGACPAGSRIGRVIAAVGAGATPLWVPQPGKRPTAVYLGGPYKGAPLSAIVVVPAQAGPFDFGDEVVRSAIDLDPNTAQAKVTSDPFPQIIEGVPVRYRQVLVELDRPDFTLNATGCDARRIEATVRSVAGVAANPFSPYRASGCASLGFKPSLSLRLFGGTRRGAHPKLRAVLRPRPGDTNIAGASVALPRSAFLDQAHIRTVCTRVQFAADQCPEGSIYGRATATSPLISEPLEGNVYLRSSDNPLPDMVVALKGPPSLPVEFNLVGRIDSVNGGIRSTFDTAPDAPVSSFVLEMQGGKKGLLVNSTNLCAKVNRAKATFIGQNGARVTTRPAMQNGCKKGKKARRNARNPRSH